MKVIMTTDLPSSPIAAAVSVLGDVVCPNPGERFGTPGRDQYSMADRLEYEGEYCIIVKVVEVKAVKGPIARMMAGEDYGPEIDFIESWKPGDRLFLIFKEGTNSAYIDGGDAQHRVFATLY